MTGSAADLSLNIKQDPDMNHIHYSGIHHAAFATSDLEKTIRYWRDLLGFKIVYGIEEKNQKQLAFQISKQMLVFFFLWEDVKPVKPKRHGEPVSGPFTFDHLAIHLASSEDLNRLQDRLVCADQPVTDVIDHGILHSIYTFDPNGIPLEFSWALPEFDLDKRPLYFADKDADGSLPVLDPVPGIWPVCEDDSGDDIRVVLPGREQKHFSKL